MTTLSTIESTIALQPARALDATHEKIARDVEAFVRSRFSVPESDAMFTRTVDLFEEGYVDSTGLVELISHIEGLYRVRLPEEVLFDASFSRIEGIARIVSELLGS
jgi:acyl carrier protein